MEQSFEDFKAAALAQGYDEVLVREWEPGQQLATHAHPFDVKALVVRGEFDLTCDGRTQHIPAGGSFELAREAPHAELYGPEGATVWVARRHAAPGG